MGANGSLPLSGWRGGRAAVIYVSPTAPLRLVPGCCSHLCVSEQCHYAVGLSTLGSAQAHLQMEQKYCAHHKKGTTIRRAFIIIFRVFSSIRFILFLTGRLIYLCSYLTGFE